LVRSFDFLPKTKIPLADKKKQLVTNVAIGYILVSVVLFAIFIFTYRMYWFRIHRQLVENRAKQSEEVSLIRMMRPFLLEKARRTAQAESHSKLLTRLGGSMLDELQSRLEAISFKDPIEDFETPDAAPTFIETPVEKDGEKRLDELLKPVMPKSGDGPFEKLLHSVTGKTKGLIEFRVFVNGIEQMVPLNWSFIGSREMNLRAENGDALEWDLRAYVVPLRTEKVALADVKGEMQELDPRALSRLGVYAFGELEPIYRGADHEFQPTNLNHYEGRAKNLGAARYESPEPLPLRGSYMGQEMTKLMMMSFLSDPKLEMTFVIERNIYEHEWAENQFFFRNRVPILTYAIMAWLVCPLVFWFSVKRTNRFQFQFTADLEGDDDHFTPALALPREEDEYEETPSAPVHEEKEKIVEAKLEKTEKPEKEAKEIFEKEEQPEESPRKVAQGEAQEKNRNEQPPVLEKENQSPRVTGSQEGPLTRRLRDPAEMGQPLDRGDVDEIRQNNIRKSSGSYNRSHDEEGDVDFLAGVESDVLKSLIKKLREQ